MPQRPRKTTKRARPVDSPMPQTYAGASAAFMRENPTGSLPRAHWPTTETFFCDETGNSGSRFYQPDQPIYAEGGWIISHENRAAAMRLVAEIEQRHKYTPKTKGTALKSNPRGRAYMLEVFEELRHVAAPFIYIVEKRYFVCSKAVETYFDPVYNCAINPDETWNPDERQSRAEKLYGAPDAIIAAFAEAYREEDPAAIVAVGEEWEEWLISKNEEVLATELRIGLHDVGREMQSEFESLHRKELPRGFDSLNMPAVAQVFQLVEQNVPPCELVHDECASFEPVYRYVFDMMRNANAAEFVMTDGRKQTYGFQRLNSLTFADSETQPLLRASDYLVACCTDFARRSFAGEPITPELAQLAYPGLGAIMVWALSHQLPESERMPQLGQVMASEKFVGRVFKNLIQMIHPA